MMGTNTLRVKIEYLNVQEDERGCVFEPLESEVLPFQRNAHLVLTHPGCVRGTIIIHEVPRSLLYTVRPWFDFEIDRCCTR